MTILEDWRVEAHIRRQRADLWWRRLGLLIVFAMAAGTGAALTRIAHWLWRASW